MARSLLKMTLLKKKQRSKNWEEEPAEIKSAYTKIQNDEDLSHEEFDALMKCLRN